MARADEAVDGAALAALRPGMAVAQVQAAFGAAWRPLAPHKGGTIDLWENSHGVVVRIDANGLVGEIAFDHRFKESVEGLRLRMSLRDARAARPDLTISEARESSSYRFGTRTDRDGTMLRVEFTGETIGRIAFTNPAALYSEPTMPPYPAAEGRPGAPFADPSLKLVVLSSLLDDKVLDLGTPEQLVAHLLGRPLDPHEECEALAPVTRGYLERYPLSDTMLAQVRRLEFDGGAEIYRYAYPNCSYWDDVEDPRRVRDLAGIERCPNLLGIRVISMIEAVDIRQLMPLRKLEQLALGTHIEGLDALADLPALKGIRVSSDRLYAEVMRRGHPTRCLFDALKKRGVRVFVHWISHSGPGRPKAFQ